ncbi:MAG: hypothetical protein AB7G28_16615 [Pirellulales bacterium]
MSRFLGRDSRRRRVLNEEALSASTAHLALRASTPEEPADEAPRYSDAAGVEHHPQVTDFLPRRFRSIGMLAAAAVGTTAIVEALHWFARPLAEKYGAASVAAFDLTAGSGIAAWLQACVLMFAAGTCVLIYSLRRHRVDDFKGRYRVWMAAAIACGLLSLESVAPIHRSWTAIGGFHTGWSALRNNAIWWLVIGGLPATWIAVRAWLDARESRLAAATLAAAFALYSVAIGSYLGADSVESRIGASGGEAMITAGANLFASWFLLIGVLAYGRYVVLDVQGLIPVRATKPTAAKSRAATRDHSAKQSSRVESTSAAPLHSFRAKMADAEPAKSASTQWVDGSEPVAEDYDEEDGDGRIRKLSKADRKRLRQQKRAA